MFVSHLTVPVCLDRWLDIIALHDHLGSSQTVVPPSPSVVLFICVVKIGSSCLDSSPHKERKRAWMRHAHCLKSGYMFIKTLRIYIYFFLASVQFSSVQSLSHVWLFATPWIAARQASLSITNSRSSLRLTSIELVMPSSHLILCCPLLLLPSIPPSIRVFSSESTLCMRWPKYWSFSIIPSKEHPGLISFRMDWLDLLAVQGTLKRLLQHHTSLLIF